MTRSARTTRTTRFGFAFDRRYQAAGLPFGITPWTSYVEVDDDELRVRFGPWRLRTARSNIKGTELSGGYAFAKTAGPVRLSFADKGITFATNGQAGLCVRFYDPVKVADPTGRLLRHPGATMTVSDPGGLQAALAG